LEVKKLQFQHLDHSYNQFPFVWIEIHSQIVQLPHILLFLLHLRNIRLNPVIISEVLLPAWKVPEEYCPNEACPSAKMLVILDFVHYLDHLHPIAGKQNFQLHKLVLQQVGKHLTR
jgi:hypothetical protein